MTIPGNSVVTGGSVTPGSETFVHSKSQTAQGHGKFGQKKELNS